MLTMLLFQTVQSLKDYVYCYARFCLHLTIGTSQLDNACFNVLEQITSEILPLFAASKNALLSTMQSLLVKYALKAVVELPNLGSRDNVCRPVQTIQMQIPQLPYVLTPVLSDISHSRMSVSLAAQMATQILS